MNEIWNGDCLKLAHDLPDDIACVITDPPYGIGYESRSATQARSIEQYNQKIENDDDPEVAVANFMDVMNVIIPKMRDDADVYVFTTWEVFDEWKAALILLGLDMKQVLIWEKGYPGMGDIEGNWGCGYEMILYAKRGNRPVHHRRRAVIHINRLATKKNIHATEKPVALLEMLVGMSTDPGDLVVDPYAGSGSTIWAAERTGRLGIGIEINDNYAKAANERLSQVDLFSQLDYQDEEPEDGQ